MSNVVRCVLRPELETLVVAGSDRLEWLNGLLTCDVSALSPGAARWGLALTKQGKIVTEAYVLARPDSVFVAISAGTASSVVDWFDNFLIMEDVEMTNASSEWAWATLHGEGAGEAARRHFGDRPTWHFGPIDFPPVGGGVVTFPRADSIELTRRLEAGSDFALMSSDQWEAFRVRHLIPAFGRDFSQKNSPHDASLERRAVSWTKGCYLGQEAVCMQDMRGKVKRRLVTLSVSGDDVVVGAPVSDEAAGAPIGEVTSVAHDSTGACYAIARVRSEFARSGVRVSLPGTTAVVVESPPGA